MPNAYGRRLRLRLFLEGIEIPIISANVQTAPNSPTVASLQIPPLAEGTRLLPRTLVHLFFLDDYEVKLPELSSEGVVTTSPEKEPEPTKHQRNVDAQNRSFNNLITDLSDEDGSASGSAPVSDLDTLSRYKVLFAGEMIGFVWNKNQASRSLVLQCQDFSNYWDYAYQYSNTGIFGPGRKALFSGGATNMHTDFLRSKGSIITEVLARGRCNTHPDLRGLAAGIIKLLETIGGTYYPNPRSKNMKRIAGQNMFFSLAELRLHITHTLAAYENDPTTQRLLRRGGWMGMFRRRLGGLGKQTSFRRAVNALQGTIFHEMYAQPCPHYKPGKFLQPTKKTVRFGSTALGGDAGRIVKMILAVLKRLETLAVIEFQGVRQDVRVRPDRNLIVQELTQIALDAGAIERAIAGLLPKVRNESSKAQAIQASAALIAIGASELASRANDRGVRKKFETEMKRLLRMMRQLAKGTYTKTVPAQREAPLLKQHIFRPDIWFGSPPRCNVLFPEDYDTIAYQRMFLQEPTRLLLKTNDEFFGEDFLFDKLYFAPQTGTVKRDKARFRDLKRGDLLDHEIMTGVLPVFQKSGEFNVFASRGSVNRNTPSFKDGYAQRAANFLYFKFRFNSRQMRVSGKFNPYIACGFPGLVIDRYVDFVSLDLHNQLRKEVSEGRRDMNTGVIPLQDISKALGTNFLGNFTEVTHAVSQEGSQGRTEITCSYPRQPEESVEFLGREDQADTVRIRVDDDAVRATAVAAYNPPKLFSLGPNGGQIIAVNDVTQAFAPTRIDVPVNNAEERFNLSQSLPLFRAKKKRQGRVQRVDVPIGIPVTARQLNSPDVLDITGDPDREITFRAFQIEEQIPRYRREQVDKPMEDLVHPGWYGDVWRPPKIGAVYQDFFGIGSINDPQAAGFLSEPIAPREDGAQSVEGQQESQGSDDPRADLISELALNEGSSIQDAVDFLVLSYSFIRQNNLNVDEFTRSYSWRPIANMLDIFGTTDLRFSEDGERVVAGIEGFHSRAFGPYDNLFGLVTPEIKSVLGIERNTTAAQRADTRGRKRAAVQQLVAALAFSRGLLG